MKKSILVSFLITICHVTGNAQTMQEARRLTDNEQFDAASGVYQSLISKSPSDASLYYYYAENLLLSDILDSARLVFEKGKAIDPLNPFIKIGNAKILFNNINSREAKAASDQDGANAELRDRYEQSIEDIKAGTILIDEATLNSTDINILTEAVEALIHYRNKDTDKAKTILDRASKIDPKNIDVLLLYGDVYTELNNGTLAADYYNRALDQDKKSARAIVSKGRLYKRSTNYEGAAAEFQNAIAIEPSYAPAHRELGETYIKLGQLNKAKEEYKKYLELSKNNCGARIRYATFLYVSKNYSDALNEINQVQQRCDSNNVTMLRIASYCYYETKDTLKGINTINRLFNLLKPEKRISKDYEYYGKILVTSDRDSSILLGIEQLQKALALDPTRPDLLLDMANAWIKLKQYSKAIELLKQKIAIGKDAKIIDLYTLAKALYYNKQFAEADSVALKVNEKSPLYATGWLLRAQINAHIDSTSETGLAKPFYEKYIEIVIADSINPPAKYNNGLAEAYGYLAYYYILKKDNSNALIYLKKKLELQLDPEEKKKMQDAIDQLEGRGPKPKNK